MRKLISILLLSLLLTPAMSWAGTCQEREAQLAAQSYDVLLRAMTNCLGDIEQDADPVVAAYAHATPNTDLALDRFQGAVGATQALLDYVHVESSKYPESWSEFQRIESQLLLERERLRKIGPELDAAQLNTASNTIFATTFWSFNAGQLAGGDAGVINLWRPTCAAGVAACPRYQAQKTLIRVVNLSGSLGKYIAHGNLLAHYQDAVLQDARWQAYFNKALPQYWWEVGVNGLRMGESLCPKAADTGIQNGFCAVPHNQLILLHPEAGLQWVSGANQDSDLTAAFLVEVLGWYRWSWDEAQLHNRMGASLVAAYSNRHQNRDWSYGVMLHAGDGYNLAVTSTASGDVGVLLNLNLATRFFGKKREYVDYLKALRKPSLSDVLLGNWPPQIDRSSP